MINNFLRDTTGGEAAGQTGYDYVTVTVNARILGDLRHHARRNSPLSSALADGAVTVTESCESGRYNATLALSPAQLVALEEELLALRQEFVDLGFTPARIRAGFDQYAVDAALGEVWSARQDLTESLAA